MVLIPKRIKGGARWKLKNRPAYDQRQGGRKNQAVINVEMPN